MSMNEQEEESGSKIYVVMAGGFIGQESDQQGLYVPIQKDSSLSKLNTIESIINESEFNNLELCEFSLIDSCSVDLEYFFELAKMIQRKINHYKTRGVVLIFGTDTLQIMAYFLHRCIVAHHKPIVITGAMRVESHLDYDGKSNVINSVKQIMDPMCSKYAHGVTVNFAGKIHSPAYVQREHSFAIDPFSSAGLGIIGMMHLHKIEWMNEANRFSSGYIPLPNQGLEPVPIVYAFPGATVDYLDGYIGKFKGIVVSGYGSGNVSDNMYYAIKRAIEGGLKVILTTNCRFGGISTEYGGIGGTHLDLILSKSLTN